VPLSVTKQIGKWCKNKHGASKIIDTFETYHSSFTDRDLQNHFSKLQMEKTVNCIFFLGRTLFIHQVADLSHCRDRCQWLERAHREARYPFVLYNRDTLTIANTPPQTPLNQPSTKHGRSPSIRGRPWLAHREKISIGIITSF
jgi:hypothetical protein